jgi:hypothetical protein
LVTYQAWILTGATSPTRAGWHDRARYLGTTPAGFVQAAAFFAKESETR